MWSLQISAGLYFIWFIPQLVLTFRQQSTDGLSVGMHCLLLIGYCADLIYGFGLHMPTLYRAVTLSGLLALGLQQVQFYYFNRKFPRFLVSVDIILSVFMLLYFISTSDSSHHKSYFDAMGFASVITGVIYAWPQIIKNHKAQSSKAISFIFVVIAIMTAVFDMISAVLLQWDWPSLIGPPLALVQHGILLMQSLYWSYYSITQDVSHESH